VLEGMKERVGVGKREVEKRAREANKELDKKRK
jgi:hypothetical protein